MPFTPSEPRRPSILALVDCNNFYVSCERVFDPSLEGRPVIVLSNNDGCIISRSNEVKALGIGMGEPFFKAREIVQRAGVRVFSSNYGLYGDMSWRVMRTLKQFATEMEIYSIDEAFLNLTTHAAAYEPTAFGREIRAIVKQWTGLPVSVGIAPTKTLAKLANNFAKKSAKAQGVLALMDLRLQTLALERSPVRDVWGVGRKNAERLERLGIRTALQLRDADDRVILNNFSVIMLRTVQELRGVPCFPFQTKAPPRKGIVSSRSFGSLVESLTDLKEAVASHAGRAAEKLREQGLAARELVVYVRPKRQNSEVDWEYANARAIRLPVPTDCTHELIRHALRGTEEIYRREYRYQKAAVQLNDLIPVEEVQTSLFDAENRSRNADLMRTLDRVNATMGSGTLKYAAEGLVKGWAGKRQHSSPAYITRWEQLPLASAGNRSDSLFGPSIASPPPVVECDTGHRIFPRGSR